MFNVDGLHISMSIGDTGAFVMKAETDGYTFTSEDRAIFTVKNGNSVMITGEYEIDENGEFLVCFHNSDTEIYQAGNYSWDVRYVLHPYRDESGKVTDGDQVITPFLPQTFELLRTVGNV